MAAITEKTQYLELAMEIIGRNRSGIASASRRGKKPRSQQNEDTETEALCSRGLCRQFHDLWYSVISSVFPANDLVHGGREDSRLRSRASLG